MSFREKNGKFGYLWETQFTDVRQAALGTAGKSYELTSQDGTHGHIMGQWSHESIWNTLRIEST